MAKTFGMRGGVGGAMLLGWAALAQAMHAPLFDLNSPPFDDFEIHLRSKRELTHEGATHSYGTADSGSRRQLSEEEEDTCAVPRTKLLCCVKENIV